MRRLWRKGMLAAIAALQTTGISLTEDVNYDGETRWSYECSDVEQHFCAPATGIYRFTLYGAQGASTAEHTGGHGGTACVELELTKNDQVDFFIGSIGNVTNGENPHLDERAEGGGATTLSMEETTIAVAGGGGGATSYADGGHGGIQLMTDDVDTDSFHTVYAAGGGHGYQDGRDAYICYHAHTGSVEGGGCYTLELYHTHEDECYTDCGAYSDFRVNSMNPAWIEACCDNCGQWTYKTGTLDSDFVTDGTWRHRKLICDKNTDKIEFYQLGCGKNETTIEASAPSCGGTSYYNETLCRNATLTAGTHEGDGRLDIRMTELDGATLSYYQYDMAPLGDITVARGDFASYPITHAIVREKNNDFSYEFIGWDNLDTAERENLQNEETVQTAVTQDRRYQAVFKEIPIEPIEIPDEQPEPTEPVEPIEPVEPTEIVEPTEPIEPVEPIEIVEPVEPVEPTEPQDTNTPDVNIPDTNRHHTNTQPESTFPKTDVLHEKEDTLPEKIEVIPQASETDITYETRTETTTFPSLTAKATWQSDTTHPKTESALTTQTIEPSEPQTTKEDRILAQPLRGRDDEPAAEETLLANGVTTSDELAELDRTERVLAIGIMSLGMFLVFLLLFLLYRYREDSYAEDADRYNR